MILVDSTIVSVATPAIMTGLQADINAVVWVTSAYLLAYAVPLLITGRLGDRFGPRNIYLIGLAVFTPRLAVVRARPASVGMLIAARVVQGLGAALMTPQTMAVITRIFPPDRRGGAMASGAPSRASRRSSGRSSAACWSTGSAGSGSSSSTCRSASSGSCWRCGWCPSCRRTRTGSTSSASCCPRSGMFLLVFGIQEGQTYGWGTIIGPISVWC